MRFLSLHVRLKRTLKLVSDIVHHLIRVAQIFTTKAKEKETVLKAQPCICKKVSFQAQI